MGESQRVNCIDGLPPALCSVRLEHLQSFVALAAELHFARAAKRVNLTQSGLSRRITFLERAVGSPLVSRSTHQVELTESGRLLLPVAADLLLRMAGAQSTLNVAMAKAR
jgi:DNA-binding transcriptional LysR family regulator